MKETFETLESLISIGITQPSAWLHIHAPSMYKGDETLIIQWSDGQEIKYRAKPLIQMLQSLLDPFVKD